MAMTLQKKSNFANFFTAKCLDTIRTTIYILLYTSSMCSTIDILTQSSDKHQILYVCNFFVTTHLHVKAILIKTNTTL